MTRSSSSSFRNTKGKLDVLGEQLTELHEDVKNSRNESKVNKIILSNFISELIFSKKNSIKEAFNRSVKN